MCTVQKNKKRLGRDPEVLHETLASHPDGSCCFRYLVLIHKHRRAVPAIGKTRRRVRQSRKYDTRQREKVTERTPNSYKHYFADGFAGLPRFIASDTASFQSPSMLKDSALGPGFPLRSSLCVVMPPASRR